MIGGLSQPRWFFNTHEDRLVANSERNAPPGGRHHTLGFDIRVCSVDGWRMI